MPRRCILKCAPEPGVRFHVFPSLESKPERFKAWVQAIGGKLDTPEDYEYYRNQRICDRHFAKENKNRYNRVDALGVPSLHLIETDLGEREKNSLGESFASSVQETLNLDVIEPTTSNVLVEDMMTRNNSLSLRKYNMYQSQIKQLRKRVNTFQKREDNFRTRLANAEKITDESAFKRIAKNMTLPAKIFTNMQFRTTSKKPSGRRFLLEEKVLSLTLYKRSPKCYSMLSRYFSLPAPKTLKRLLSEIKLGPGINTIVMEKLKKTVSELTMEDRLCTLIFDEMSITPQLHYDAAKDQLKGFTSHGHKLADHALVFMVKGIKKTTSNLSPTILPTASNQLS